MRMLLLIVTAQALDEPQSAVPVINLYYRDRGIVDASCLSARLCHLPRKRTVVTVEAHGFVQAWLDVNLPEQGADPARLARRCRAAAKELGVCIEVLEPEWGAPLKDIILGILERREQTGRLH